MILGKLKTYFSLGVISVARVAGYRLACRSGYYLRRMPVSNWTTKQRVFSPPDREVAEVSDDSREKLLRMADDLLAGKVVCFSSAKFELGSPPDWFLDPLEEEKCHSEQHWSQLNEFSGGDIKILWESSRFEWAPRFAQAWRLSGDDRYVDALNLWIQDWLDKNPKNQGCHWKCGQEVSIRTINLLLTARLLGEDGAPTDALIEIVSEHCRRVFPTIRYAVGQDNNHGTSEAAALFISGCWLRSVRPEVGEGERWMKAGRRWLENRVKSLVGKDGSFSQYSTNYHRVLIDTLCQVEFWRKELKEQPFSDLFYSRSSAAIDWLASVTDEVSGDAPNMGANDGARLFDLTATSFRDFRPTIGLGMALFQDKDLGNQGANEVFKWLGVSSAKSVPSGEKRSVIHREGGDVVLRSRDSHAIVRFSQFSFRPSHADCLHLDLWHCGKNIFRDGGTYSYNTDLETLDYYSGTESHNTVQFDNRSQMPRIGRFLFGEWLRMKECSEVETVDGALSWSGSYVDWKKASHRRSVQVLEDRWEITDLVKGEFSSATLRWRLIPGNWVVRGNTCQSQFARLVVLLNGIPVDLTLTEGWESRYYMERSPVPVIEILLPPGENIVLTQVDLEATAFPQGMMK